MYFDLYFIYVNYIAYKHMTNSGIILETLME